MRNVSGILGTKLTYLEDRFSLNRLQFENKGKEFHYGVEEYTNAPWFLIIPFTFKVFTSKRIFHCIKPGRAPVITPLGNSFFWCTYQFTKHKIAISEGLIVQKRGVRTRDEALKMSAWKAKQPQESSSLLRGGLFMSSGDWGEGKIKACGGVFGGSKVSLFCR